jgi:chaperonin GroES
MSEFHVIGDRVMVKPLEGERELKTRGGIILPDNVRYSSRKGTVMGVGPGPRSNATGERSKMDIEVGDIAHYVLGAGIDIQIGGEHCIMMPEVEVIAVERA